MLGKLFEKIRTSIAIHRLNEMPAIQYGRRAIDTYWTGNREITKDFSEHMVKRQTEKMMEEVIRVANAPDPRMANRENLTNWILECVKLPRKSRHLDLTREEVSDAESRAEEN